MTDNNVVYVKDKRIEIYFDFTWATLDKVRTLPDATFDKPNRMWWTPATSFHADRIIKGLGGNGFYIGQDVYELSLGDKKAPEFPIDKRLYKFQRDGVRFIVATMGRCILADGMGLGKTPQALAFVNIRRGKTLVVAPANVTWKWKAEVKKWTTLKAEVVSTSKEEMPDADIHIMSYDIMTRRAEELSKKPYDTAIWDECHYLKNYKALRVKAAKRIVSSGIPHVLFLSGTPFLNRPDELFTTLNMLDPLSYPTFSKFAQRYLGAQWYGGSWVFPNKLTNVSELRDRLKTCMIRRTKGEVLKELPEKTRTIVPVDIPMAEYNKAKRNLHSWYKKEGKNLKGFNVLARMTALRQIVGREKIKATVALVQDLLQDDEQVVIFCHHKDVVAAVRAGLSEYKVGLIVGDTKPKERQAITERFLDNEIEVVIISVAGAEGIDLYSASHIVFAEREWVPAKEEQAEDRLHRIGQKNAVMCWYIAAKGTIDERLARIVEDKRETFGQVISQDDIVTEILEYLEEE